MDTVTLLDSEEFGHRKFIHLGNQKPKQSSGARLSSPTTEKSSPLKEKEFPILTPQTKGMRSGNKQWMHPSDALLKGHILYNVKFLGECTVENPKGTEVVKEAIRKMKFNKHIKRAEGQKPPKVELTISADGVTIQDPRTKMIMHQYPLHRISYCADDKSDKRMFTFIAKSANTSQHFCYVFDSDKCAEEITLTVGQAFDLAYKRFLESSSKDMDVKKQFLLLQKKVQTLTFENQELKKRISELESIKDRSDVQDYMRSNQISDLSTVTYNLQESSTDDDFSSTSEQEAQSAVGRRLENLVFDDFPPSSQTNGTNGTNGNSTPGGAQRQNSAQPTPLLSPPPPSTRTRSHTQPAAVGVAAATASQKQKGFSGNPFSPTSMGAASSSDPFGMGVFNPSTSELDRAIQNVDQELLDLQTGFSRGLSIGTDDFSLDDLDPLNQRS
ncbi:PTB domain-containing engulfment adapter protein 1-like isoform X2 [Haliotis rufescens]|uniref:PTB domain-containing engulfment adapter protein 1-like isoform X2 n=1 Tax=Haliotis rufescens TaxID=6454 RepID=UPI00201E8DE9|nr:PTB domain-containing engulfment adapter protein 1-like isoform X2 [Haliotis rufescens]